MKKFLIGAAAMMAAVPATAATYLPTGVQTNVALSTVTNGGWSQCYAGAYSASGASISSILAGCGGGTNLMLAARVAGSDTLLLLAQAPTVDVTFNTGSGATATHNANGVEWYFSTGWSWGFAPGGQAVNRNSCDVANLAAMDRLCWHTSNGTLNGGWRAGSANGLLSGYERLIFVGTPSAVAGVPEPATWAMMMLGFGALGAVMRRKPKVTARVRYAWSAVFSQVASRRSPGRRLVRVSAVAR